MRTKVIDFNIKGGGECVGLYNYWFRIDVGTPNSPFSIPIKTL